MPHMGPLTMGDDEKYRCAYCLCTLVPGLNVEILDGDNPIFCYECDNYVTEVV